MLYLLLMYDWEHFSGIDDAIDLQIRSIIILALFDGLLIVVAIDESLRVGLVEPIEFVLDILAEGGDLFLGEPLGVEVASSLVFDEVLLFFGIISFSSP